MGASPMLLLVTSTARISSVCSLIPICILRHNRRLGPPCLRAFYASSPSALMPVLSISRCSGPVEPLYGMATDNVFWRWHKGLKSGTDQFRPASLRRLATNPALCLNGNPNRTLRLRQACIAASLLACWRPRRPEGTAFNVIPASNQIESDPRIFSERLYSAQFRILYFMGIQLPITTSYHAGFVQWKLVTKFVQ